MPQPTQNISVVIPCFNAAGYLAEALDSVMRQTLKPAEILVVDDASTDRSREVAREFGSAVRLIELRSNSGSAALPKDVGLREAQGEFIAFLDADDVWAASKLELQMPLLR